MAIRSEMQYIIDFARELIHDVDTTGSNEFFTDQQIQDRLDLHRLDAYSLKLRAADTLVAGGTIEWHDFFAPYPFWEEGAVIQQLDGTTKTPDISDWRVGKWTFTTKQEQPLVIRGRCYNVYMAASKLAFQMMQEMRNQFNFTADGLTVQRIAQIKETQQLATSLNQMGWGGVGPGTQVQLVRKDIRG